MIGPSLSHVLIGLPLFFAAVLFVKFLPIWFAGFLANLLYWGGRELAQSMRPKEPFKLNWTWTNTRNLLYPLCFSLTLAFGLWIVF